MQTFNPKQLFFLCILEEKWSWTGGSHGRWIWPAGSVAFVDSVVLGKFLVPLLSLLRATAM